MERIFESGLNRKRNPAPL